MIDSGPHTVDMYSSLRSIEYKKLIKKFFVPLASLFAHLIFPNLRCGCRSFSQVSDSLSSILDIKIYHPNSKSGSI